MSLNPAAFSKTLPLRNVSVNDPFWSSYVAKIREVVIPYQWAALNDRIPGAEPSHAVLNFRIAAGREQGEFHGFVFQDSDLAKWIEAVGYSLATQPDKELEKTADELIDLIAESQQDDGYLNTYFTIKEPNKRWSNLYDCHELYCAGHMIEAAVAYYQATGKRKLLDVMSRFVEHIDSRFGTEPGKTRGYCGHQEIELALIKLYEATGNEKYKQLSQYFIEERGQQPHFFLEEWERRGRTSHWQRGVTPPPNTRYNQSHLPVREQTEAVGHAVRAVYMYTAMADLALHMQDDSLYQACRTLWSNIVTKQMYITGGIGSTHHGEAFSFDYDLPNDTVYAETCASIGLIFFAHRMLRIEPKGEYADVIERALYNNVISAMSQDGKHYFYVNPLEVWPQASRSNPGRHHVKPVRQPWYGCACCPPNIARLLASLGQYIYTTSESTVFTHLYIGGEAAISLGSETIRIEQQTNYPWDGDVSLRLSGFSSKKFALALRIPGWCEHAKLTVNGHEQELQGLIKDGYVYLDRIWKEGDTIRLQLQMAPRLIMANPKVRANAGKAAIERGPLVYCLEEADNGTLISSIRLPVGTPLTEKQDSSLPEEPIMIEADAWRSSTGDWNSCELYRPAQHTEKPFRIRAVPYYLWGNREPGEMAVWIRC